jgi:hypothetical protein
VNAGNPAPTTVAPEGAVNPSGPHAALIAAYRREEADAAHKTGLIKALAKKGPGAIQTATVTAAKAEKRRDSFAKKLKAVGVILTD